MTANNTLSNKAIAEVVRLHEFFTDWFAGTCAKTAFAENERAFAPDFRMIMPEGNCVDAASIISWLRSAHGSRPEKFGIAIRDPRAVWQQDNAVLIEYIEEQTNNGELTQRQSTALFTADETAPCGVVWAHLQETWLQAPQQIHNQGN